MTENEPSLETTYLGLQLANPIVCSSSPLTGHVDHICQLVDAGAAAIVLPSMFEEQIEHNSMAIHFGLEFGAGSHAEAAAGYFPELDDYNTGSTRYLALVREARDRVDVPIIASLNGTTRGGWTLYARVLEDAGVDALELNIYLVAADIDETSEVVERRYLDLVSSVRSAVTIPLAVKVGPYFSAMGNMARRLCNAGADALVLFNRFYQPDIDIDAMAVRPDLELSTPDEMRLTLRWTAILHKRIPCDLAATTGVHSPQDVVKMILAGANAVMVASVLLDKGPQHLRLLVGGLSEWLEENGYSSVAQARGALSQLHSPDPEAFERANYMRTLTTYSSDWLIDHPQGSVP